MNFSLKKMSLVLFLTLFNFQANAAGLRLNCGKVDTYLGTRVMNNYLTITSNEDTLNGSLGSPGFKTFILDLYISGSPDQQFPEGTLFASTLENGDMEIIINNYIMLIDGELNGRGSRVHDVSFYGLNRKLIFHPFGYYIEGCQIRKNII